MDIAARVRNVSMEVLKARLVAQVRSQMGTRQPKAVVFYGTHEHLEPTVHTVADLQRHFANRGICFVEFPSEHRPVEFFKMVFDIFEHEAGRLREGEVLPLPIDAELQHAIGAESDQLFDNIQASGESIAARFDHAWAVNPKGDAWELG